MPERKRKHQSPGSGSRTEARGFRDQKPIQEPIQSASTSTGPAQTRPRRYKPFRFLDFPPELRNTVYDFLFAESTTTIQPGACYAYPRYSWRFKHQPSQGPPNIGLPALLAASKQVREEATNIFYASTEFVVRHFAHARALLVKLGREKVPLVTSLRYRHVEAAADDASDECKREVALWAMERLDIVVAQFEVRPDRRVLRAELQASDGFVLAEVTPAE